ARAVIEITGVTNGFTLFLPQGWTPGSPPVFVTAPARGSRRPRARPGPPRPPRCGVSGLVLGALVAAAPGNAAPTITCMPTARESPVTCVRCPSEIPTRTWIAFSLPAGSSVYRVPAEPTPTVVTRFGRAVAAAPTGGADAFMVSFGAACRMVSAGAMPAAESCAAVGLY